MLEYYNLVPNDPLYPKQWYIVSTYGMSEWANEWISELFN